jgi:uncharacterized protein YcfJ
MNKSLITGLVMGAVVAMGGGAIAGFKLLDRQQSHAQVLDVKPIMKTVRTPREECRDELVTQTNPTRDPHQITGSVLGAVVGGVLGHQVGGGTGREIATVAGAAAGGYAGNRVQKHLQDNDTTTKSERHCATVYDSHKERVGYEVRYRLGDKEGQVRMNHDPGQAIPVRDGNLVLEDAAPTRS